MIHGNLKIWITFSHKLIFLLWKNMGRLALELILWSSKDRWLSPIDTTHTKSYGSFSFLSYDGHFGLNEAHGGSRTIFTTMLATTFSMAMETVIALNLIISEKYISTNPNFQWAEDWSPCHTKIRKRWNAASYQNAANYSPQNCEPTKLSKLFIYLGLRWLAILSLTQRLIFVL